jgi:hypothetical protein
MPFIANSTGIGTRAVPILVLFLLGYFGVLLQTCVAAAPSETLIHGDQCGHCAASQQDCYRWSAADGACQVSARTVRSVGFRPGQPEDLQPYAITSQLPASSWPNGIQRDFGGLRLQAPDNHGPPLTIRYCVFLI